MAPSSKKIKVASFSTSLSSGASDHANTIARLQAEIDGLRAENQQVHAEFAQLRAAHLTLQSVTIPHLEAELQGLRCAQSDLQQTLTSPDSWPSIALQIPNEGQTFNFVDYRPADIVAVLKRKFEMPLEDEDFRALLHTKGFDDVRQDVWVHDAGDWYFPMSYFSAFGDLEMCKWLYQNGAAEDIDRVDDDNLLSPLYLAGWGNELPVCKWLFAMGADIYREDDSNGYTLMHRACERGNLSVCQWLVEVGFGFMNPNPDAETFMALACRGGHLSVCKWLYDLGPVDDISRPTSNGWTPMSFACEFGHLSVCEWLYEMGATEDISKEHAGRTPLQEAFNNGHIPVMKWLILKGALHNSNLTLHHANVTPDLACTCPLSRSRRDDLLAWAEGIVDASRSFRGSITMGTFLPEGPAAALATPLPAVSILNGHTVVLEVVADFLGLVRGRELRNVRLFADFVKREKLREEYICAEIRRVLTEIDHSSDAIITLGTIRRSVQDRLQIDLSDRRSWFRGAVHAALEEDDPALE